MRGGHGQEKTGANALEFCTRYGSVVVLGGRELYLGPHSEWSRVVKGTSAGIIQNHL